MGEEDFPAGETPVRHASVTGAQAWAQWQADCARARRGIFVVCGLCLSAGLMLVGLLLQGSMNTWSTAGWVGGLLLSLLAYLWAVSRYEATLRRLERDRDALLSAGAHDAPSPAVDPGPDTLPTSHDLAWDMPDGPAHRLHGPHT